VRTRACLCRNASELAAHTQTSSMSHTDYLGSVLRVCFARPEWKWDHWRIGAAAGSAHFLRRQESTNTAEEHHRRSTGSGHSAQAAMAASHATVVPGERIGAEALSPAALRAGPWCHLKLWDVRCFYDPATGCEGPPPPPQEA